MISRTLEDIITILSKPTPHDRVRFVPQAINKEEKTALAVPYFDARFTMERLDEACGPFGWQSEVKQIGDVMCVGIGILNPGSAHWMWKWDTGQESDPDDDEDQGVGGAKALISGGLKRAGVQWTIGRDVYAIRKRRYAVTLRRDNRFQSWVTIPTVNGSGTSGTSGTSGGRQAPATASAPAAQPGSRPVDYANRFGELAMASGMDQEARKAHLTECMGPDGKVDWKRAVELFEAQH